MAEVGNDLVRIRNVVEGVGNNGVGVHSGMTNFRIGWMRLYLELGLEEESWRWSYRSGRTYVEHMANLV